MMMLGLGLLTISSSAFASSTTCYFNQSFSTGGMSIAIEEVPYKVVLDGSTAQIYSSSGISFNESDKKLVASYADVSKTLVAGNALSAKNSDGSFSFYYATSTNNSLKAGSISVQSTANESQMSCYTL
jgi:hypothetical protein